MGLTKRELSLFAKKENDVAPDGSPGLLLAVSLRHRYDVEAKKTLDEMEAVVLSVYFEAFGHLTLDIKIPADKLAKSEIENLQVQCQQYGELPVKFKDLTIGLYQGRDGIGISSTAAGVHILSDYDLNDEKWRG